LPAVEPALLLDLRALGLELALDTHQASDLDVHGDHVLDGDAHREADDGTAQPDPRLLDRPAGPARRRAGVTVPSRAATSRARSLRQPRRLRIVRGSTVRRVPRPPDGQEPKGPACCRKSLSGVADAGAIDGRLPTCEPSAQAWSLLDAGHWASYMSLAPRLADCAAAQPQAIACAT
jgi:hypothetical protein